MRLIKEALQTRNKLVNVAIVGCGWWGSGVAKYLYKMSHMHPKVLVDKDIGKCIQTYLDVGVYEGQILRIESSEDLSHVKDYRHIVMSDLNYLKEFRNSLIHASKCGHGLDIFIFELKYYIERLLGFHLFNNYKFKSIGEACKLLDQPFKDEDLKNKLDLVLKAQQFRENVFSQK